VEKVSSRNTTILCDKDSHLHM